ncbi:hypothetical protein AgCh_025179 [Apium graveolens]
MGLPQSGLKEKADGPSSMGLGGADSQMDFQYGSRRSLVTLKVAKSTVLEIALIQAFTRSYWIYKDCLSWMRNITVGELVDVKPPVVTLRGIEKVGRIVEVLRNTTHNRFPVVDDREVPTGHLATGKRELHGLVLSSPPFNSKKEMVPPSEEENKRMRSLEKFTSVDLAERRVKIEEVAVTKDDMEMYVDLHSVTNTTAYTVVETMSVAKALVLFREVGLRHMLVLPKFQSSGEKLRYC